MVSQDYYQGVPVDETDSQTNLDRKFEIAFIMLHSL